MADKPVTREEKYLAYLTGDYTGEIPKPITRKEKYLYELCLKGMSGEVSPEEIKSAVNEYLEKNPVKPGATTEQAQQIEQNKTEIASLKTETSSLKESISTKITKFYASSQGETHLADSDDGKIMDMMLYGKSEQKQYSGKNLLNATLQTTTQNGVTCTNNGDGTYTLSGTATADALFSINLDKSAIKNGMRVVGCPENGSDKTYHAYIYDSTTYAFYDYGNGGTIRRTDESSNISYNIRVRSGITVNNLLFKPMIVDASLYPDATYDDYEPYTGGIPSPNPSYPQEIKSVVNPTVKVCGKNLWNEQWINGTLNSSGEFASDPQRITSKDFIDVSPKTQYYSTAVENSIYYIHAYTKDEKHIGYISSNGQVFTTPDKCYKLKFVCESTYGNTYKNDIAIIKGASGNYEPYHEQTVTLPYTLNAIPVSSGGNVTIDGQQYIADYVDVERGKLIQMVWEIEIDGKREWRITSPERYEYAIDVFNTSHSFIDGLCNLYRVSKERYVDKTIIIGISGPQVFVCDSDLTTLDDVKKMFDSTPLNIKYPADNPTEIDLTTEEITAFKALATYYPITNISINSEQLDGYTVFNYPISMANGWNYVKKQLNDNRDYIYDMDIQSAEAYVNSEYAVALTELEV